MSPNESDQEIDHSDKSAVPGECHRCHQRFPATDLKEASVPSFVGLMSATDVWIGRPRTTTGSDRSEIVISSLPLSAQRLADPAGDCADLATNHVDFDCGAAVWLVNRCSLSDQFGELPQAQNRLREPLSL